MSDALHFSLRVHSLQPTRHLQTSRPKFFTLLPLSTRFAPSFLHIRFSLSLSFLLQLHLSLSSAVFAQSAMGDDGRMHAMEDDEAAAAEQIRAIGIYPLSNYYFGSKEALLFKDETLADRVQRMKSNYAAYGLRTCVEAVMLLPGGRLRPNESDIDGLKRKLSRKLSANGTPDASDWEVGECLGMWWRPDFETLLYPYLSNNVKGAKECTKLFLVKLPESRKFIVPKNLKLIAVPLCQIHENHKTYGPVISGIPQLLSKFSFNIIET